MKITVSYLLYVIAIVITGLVVAAKYFDYSVPVVSPLVMHDAAASLLVAIVLALVSRWV